MEYTPRLTTIMEMAEREATERGIGRIGVEHVALAILVEGVSVPAQVIDAVCGTDPVLHRLREVLDSDGYRGIRPEHEGP